LYLNNVRIIIQLRENCNTARVYQRKDRLRNNDFFSHEHNWQPVNLGQRLAEHVYSLLQEQKSE